MAKLAKICDQSFVFTRARRYFPVQVHKFFLLRPILSYLIVRSLAKTLASVVSNNLKDRKDNEESAVSRFKFQLIYGIPLSSDGNKSMSSLVINKQELLTTLVVVPSATTLPKDAQLPRHWVPPTRAPARVYNKICTAHHAGQSCLRRRQNRTTPPPSSPAGRVVALSVAVQIYSSAGCLFVMCFEATRTRSNARSSGG